MGDSAFSYRMSDDIEDTAYVLLPRQFRDVTEFHGQRCPRMGALLAYSYDDLPAK